MTVRPQLHLEPVSDRPAVQQTLPLFLNVTQVADLLGPKTDPRTVRAALERGEIPGVQIGRRWYIPTARFYAEVAGIPTDDGDAA